VHKDFQKQGIASKLLLELERKAETLQADVISSDVSITVRSFFENRGYDVIKENINRVNEIDLINYRVEKNLRDNFKSKSKS